MKFTKEEKLKYVMAYKNHEYIPVDPKSKLNLDKWHKLVRRWVIFYDKYGEAGLARKTTTKYSYKFKYNAVKKFLSGGSYLTIALSLGLNNPSLIANWVRLYRKKGLAGLKSKQEGNKPDDTKQKRFRKESKGIGEGKISLNFRECLSKKIEGLGGRRGAKPRQKYEAILQVKKEYKDAKLKELLKIAKLSKSSYFYEKKRDFNKQKEDELKNKITNIFNENKQRYGVRRITIALNNEGIKINHKKVQRLMRTLSLKGIQPKCKYNSYRGNVGKVADDLIIMEYVNKKGQIHHKSDFSCTGPNQKWTTDVSQFNFPWGKCYLSPIKDMFTSEIISWNLSRNPNIEQTFDMLNKAFKKHTDLNGLIFHSDQGWQYQHCEYVKKLKNKGILQSMSRKGNCLDNCIMESFFARIKTELYFGHENEYKDFEEFKLSVSKYIDWYNNKRIKYYKQIKKWMTPSECREAFSSGHPIKSVL